MLKIQPFIAADTAVINPALTTHVTVEKKKTQWVTTFWFGEASHVINFSTESAAREEQTAFIEQLAQYLLHI